MSETSGDAEDLKWEKIVAQAEASLARQKPLAENSYDESPSPYLNAASVLITPSLFVLAFFFPEQLGAIAMLVWILGSLGSMGIMCLHGWTNLVPSQTKEMALSCLLGDLIVLGLFMLKPV